MFPLWIGPVQNVIKISSISLIHTIAPDARQDGYVDGSAFEGRSIEFDADNQPTKKTPLARCSNLGKLNPHHVGHQKDSSSTYIALEMLCRLYWWS